MNDEFARRVLEVVVGKVCLPLGVHSMHMSVCETLTDVLKTFLLTLGRTTASYSVHGELAEGREGSGEVVVYGMLTMWL